MVPWRVSNTSLPAQGYWGKITATLDWCEPNYQHSYYIAETWNSFSNLVYVAVALYAIWAHNSKVTKLHPRFLLVYLLLIAIGIGSFLFHASLLREYQLFDELPMLYITLAALHGSIFTKIFDNRMCLSEKILFLLGAAIMVVIGLVETLIQLYYPEHYDWFLLMFGGILLVCDLFQIYRSTISQSKYKKERRNLVVKNIVAFLLAFGVWLIDNNLCPYVEVLKLHSWWHFLTAYSVHHNIKFSEIVFLEANGIDFVVRSDKLLATIEPPAEKLKSKEQ